MTVPEKPSTVAFTNQRLTDTGRSRRLPGRVRRVIRTAVTRLTTLSRFRWTGS
ncbi:hypothetical protein ACIGNX_04680 [Actinosynnema sp. NPDC053489]|uniref:hypothetical protein n=1 Tax=Actinosynnema sp. NPDC053489 TaxID=3363916 RepID=UPI0037C86C63